MILIRLMKTIYRNFRLLKGLGRLRMLKTLLIIHLSKMSLMKRYYKIIVKVKLYNSLMNPKPHV